MLIAVLLPAISAIACYCFRNSTARKGIVILSTTIMVAMSVYLTYLMNKNGGVLRIDAGQIMQGLNIGFIIKILDFLLLLYIAFIGIKLKKPIIVILSVIQFAFMAWFEAFSGVIESETVFYLDFLSVIMVLLVSIIGPIITVFALGYMEKHEHHLKLQVSKQPKFFAILFIFLGAMNFLVMTDNLLWMYFFWEVTTVCSFLLIGHDQNEESIKNSIKALWINSLGGVAFMLAIMVFYNGLRTLSLNEIVQSMAINNFSGQGFVGVPLQLLPLGLGLLCIAGFTKAAQFPFQSWLLGAMVAPTPVSALLHSSTMVKAGVYLVVKIAPALANTMLGNIVAISGAFTFFAASALAVSQSNSKRVLAYSTIANLGLIICCAGLGNYVAISAAILLIIFHALSKGLLFMCVGTIEQGIESRDIEDMQGLMKKMPFTTIITVIGMVTMLLPPFGVLMTKWLTIEAAVSSPIVLILVVLGSAITVLFWTKWMGIILTMSYKPRYFIEPLAASVKTALSIMIVGVFSASIFVVQLFNFFVYPYLTILIMRSGTVPIAGNGGIWLANMNTGLVGGAMLMPLFLVLIALAVLIPYLRKKTKPANIRKPYLCGENTNDMRGINFTGPAEMVDSVVVHNYYFRGALGEGNLTLWMNCIAIAMILIMFGVVIR